MCVLVRDSESDPGLVVRSSTSNQQADSASATGNFKLNASVTLRSAVTSNQQADSAGSST
jgi:hypothetical protein